MPCSPLCTTLLDRHRISGPKLLATSRHHITPTEMMPRAEWQCLVFYSSYFPMRRIPEFSSFPPSLSILVLVLVLSSVPVPTPVSLPVSVTLLVSHPTSVPVPVLRSFSRLRPRPLSDPTLDLVPVSVRSFSFLGDGNTLGRMRVHRHRALRAELLSVELMSRAE